MVEGSVTLPRPAPLGNECGEESAGNHGAVQGMDSVVQRRWFVVTP